VGELRTRAQEEAAEDQDLELFFAACDLFFPQRRKVEAMNNGSVFEGLRLQHHRSAAG
jgi:hypothetical protein